MEIKETPISNLEQLSKKYQVLPDEMLDKSLAKTNEEKQGNVSFLGSKEVSFEGREEDERDLASSKLQEELTRHHVYPGHLYSSSTWGGLDEWSGNRVHSALNDARNNNVITDSEYRKLFAMLKAACYYQS